jgi:AcrR family transcriptional regulator
VNENSTAKTVLFLAVAGPAILYVVVEAMFLLMAAFGGEHPRWPAEKLNLAEAVAVRNTGEVMRLVEEGEDPNRHYPIRQGLLDGDPSEATPLEAATSERRPELIEILIARGARLAPADWVRLRCFALGRERNDVAAALDAVKPAEIVPQCQPEVR